MELASAFGNIAADLERQRMIAIAWREAERSVRAAERDEKFMRRPAIDVDYERLPADPTSPSS